MSSSSTTSLSHWAGIRDDLNATTTVINDLSVQTYRPKKAVTIATMSALAIIAQQAVGDIRDRALENTGKKPAGFFRINPLTSIEYAKKGLTPDKSRDIVVRTVAILKRTGLTQSEYLECIEKGAKLAEAYFSTVGHPIFMYGTPRGDIKNWQLQTSVSLLDFAYRFVGINASEQPVEFLADELEFFKIAEEEIKKNPKLLSCLAFAFLKTREIRAKDLIFNECPDEFLKNIIKNLLKWNYQPVQEPEEGDLVLYLTDENVVLHVGCMGKDGSVYSKLGIATPFSHQHGLFDIPSGFGSTVIFFRKSAATEK